MVDYKNIFLKKKENKIATCYVNVFKQITFHHHGPTKPSHTGICNNEGKYISKQQHYGIAKL